VQVPGLLKKFNFVWIAVLVSSILWVGDSLIDYIYFGGSSYFAELLPEEPKELWMRMLNVTLILLFGSYMQRISNQKDLTHNELKLGATIFDNAVHAIMVTDDKNCIIKINDTFERITGYTKSEALGNNPRILQSGKHDQAFYETLWEKLHRDDSWEGEIWSRRPNGELYLKEMSITLIRDADGHITNHVGIFRDISHIKVIEEELKQLAHYDVLTNLANRSLLNAHLKQAINLARRNEWQFALVFLDLDHFKEVNDSLGHNAGDDLLVEVARRLQGCVRESDLIARPGGDEFVILLENVSDVSDISEMLAKIKSSLANPFMLDGCEIFANASMGVCLYPHDGEDPETLLRNADSAMYKVKKEGRNNWEFYSKDMNQQMRHRLQMSGNLRRAAEENQFNLIYQPLMDLKTNKIVGAEALIRWEHPDLGTISPDNFIPLAEETGVIEEIGIWVLREACRQFCTWRDNGLYLRRISVNVSARQFRNKDFVSHVSGIIKETGIDPWCLELEITESLLLQSTTTLLTDIHRLRSLGVSFSIDDFGTGFSSLSYLKQFPISNVKIDGSFVCNIPKDKDNMAITNTIIHMANNLNMRVIAEGVETEEQLTFLRENDCDEVQGYLIKRPVPAQEFETFLLEWKPVRGLPPTLSVIS
jgi:diguanylate cyclase (GGDEF)-like protein/PAS domain S-box-containing protein